DKLRAKWPKESPDLAIQLDSVGQLLLKAKAFAEAEPLFREGLTISDKKPLNGWVILNMKSGLGTALLGKTKSANAEPLLLAGYEGVKGPVTTMPAHYKDVLNLAEALERLVQLYEAWDKPDEAKKWRAVRDQQNSVKLADTSRRAGKLEL